MIQRTQMWEQFASLPPATQRQVEAFVAFLSSRAHSGEGPAEPSPIADEPFIGMWRNREDLSDASAWVRRMRGEEWGG